jgi:hypothetical protein
MRRLGSVIADTHYSNEEIALGGWGLWFECDAVAEFFETLDQGTLEMFLIQIVEVVQAQIAVEFAGHGERVTNKL